LLPVQAGSVVVASQPGGRGSPELHNPRMHDQVRIGFTTGLFSLVLLVLSACTVPPEHRPNAAESVAVGSSGAVNLSYRWLNRLTWGANASLVAAQSHFSLEAYVAQQLRPPHAQLPGPIEVQIRSMTITQRPPELLVPEMAQRRRDADALTDESARKAAQQSYQQEMNRLAREAATRHVLRALYSPNQIQAQMVWFWLNHFSVFQNKGDLRALVGDYEESAVRPAALGKFRDLLGAAVQHPAMLRYLDNDRNALGRLNENLARELLELHTLGIDGGYTQRDVQEMARVLTGVGVNTQPGTPTIKRELQGYYLRRGLFEFNPNRHDFGPKQLLGQPLLGKGLAELHEALDRLALHPSTATLISRKMAQFWLGGDPSPDLLSRMRETFIRTQGDIAQTLSMLLQSAEFAQASAKPLKDPTRYVLSALRLAYDDKPILNAGPVLNWLNRLGQPLYGRQTPDGYPMDASAWTSPGQMATRFEIARVIGSGSAGLFKTDGPQPQEQAAFPLLSNALYFQSIQAVLGERTRSALAQAGSPQEWNTFLLSSPEFMSR
jgi:uncharacterized protein (DUF1800 family)